MKKRNGIERFVLFGLACFTALAFVLTPTIAGAQEQDTDRDGYMDWEEELGEIIPQGMQDPFPISMEIPDAFVILVPTEYGPTFIPDGWSDLMTGAPYQGGLGFNVNIINNDVHPADPDRWITPLQKAGRITEDTFNAIGQQLGWCQQGTLNDEDDCVVWTARIENHIMSICGDRYPGPDCVLDNGDGSGVDLLDSFVTWALLHEYGHASTCARCYLEELGGNHTPVGTGWIMDQAVWAREKKGKVTFYIPAHYSPETQAAADLAVEKDSSVCEEITDKKKK